MMDVINDEIALPEDPEGETKVNKDGHLQGGRDYRVRVFTILGRGDRLYMLSTEPARCTGFRDSYLFFTKHLQLHKIIIGEDEKKDLISRDIIPHSYKGRAIGVVTARSVFREFGARIVIGGRKIMDDYQVKAAKERGDIEGELADPNDRLPAPGEPYNKNQYVAWHGASQVYHNNAPSVPLQPGKPAPGKRKTNITTSNWQFEHAREARYLPHLLVIYPVFANSFQPLQLYSLRRTSLKPQWRLRHQHQPDVLSQDHAAKSRQMGAC
jgi:chromatin structure-remodeling complex protein RSC7